MAGWAKRVLSSTRANGSSPDALDAALEQLGTALGHGVAHVGRLAPLPGEEDGGHWAHPVRHVPTYTPATVR